MTYFKNYNQCIFNVSGTMLCGLNLSTEEFHALKEMKADQDIDSLSLILNQAIGIHDHPILPVLTFIDT